MQVKNKNKTTQKPPRKPVENFKVLWYLFTNEELNGFNKHAY